MRTIRIMVAAAVAALLAASANAQEICREQIVDLGLSVKWAGWNIGASAPEEYGGHYAWGETEEKEEYTMATYKWSKGTDRELTKYCSDEAYGCNDGKSVLDPEDDVATVKWGKDWRMPTKKEMDEILKKCKWEGISYRGVNGFRCTGPNGNAVFFPFAGDRYSTKVDLQGIAGLYSTASVDHISPYASSGMYILSGRTNPGCGFQRDFGRSVRAVYTGK